MIALLQTSCHFSARNEIALTESCKTATRSEAPVCNSAEKRNANPSLRPSPSLCTINTTSKNHSYLQAILVTCVAARRLNGGPSTVPDPVVACDRPDVRTRVRRLGSPSACGSIIDGPALRASRHTGPGHGRHTATSMHQLEASCGVSAGKTPTLFGGTFGCCMPDSRCVVWYIRNLQLED